MTDEPLKEAIKARLKKETTIVEPSKTPKTYSGMIMVSAAFLLSAVILFVAFSGKYGVTEPTAHNLNQITNSENVSVITASGSVIINQGVAMRQWSELPLEERRSIKEEARRRFPQIKLIGQRINWKPVATWLAEEKHVTVTSVRDLFRG